jgi:MFS family permease
MRHIFRSLRGFNYRVWAIGALISNIGTWMQRTAQDWIVLTQLTNNNATAVGIVMALQFGPQFLLLPWIGVVADRVDRRKFLIATQTAMGLLGLGLGILAVAGWVRLWHVYLFALLLGCVTAFDSPVRATFVAELVEEDDLANAVALNSTSFNAARMIGPAIAGVLIAIVGSGGVFLINAATFAAVIYSLKSLRLDKAYRERRARRSPGTLIEGIRYVGNRPDLKAVLWMLFFLSTFGLNYPIFISTMAVTAFHAGASEYGLLTSILGMGSVTGALLAARVGRPRMITLLTGATVFGVCTLVAATMPNYALFGIMLFVIGVAAQNFTTSTTSLVQLSTEPEMRGRVVAILLAVALGGTPVGSPLIGWVADTLGPRWAVAAGGTAGLIAAAIGLIYMSKHPNASPEIYRPTVRVID